MCGIAGFIHFGGKPACPEVIRRMTDAIRHRGPDGEGQFIDGAFGLGHRRLAIIDLSDAGSQPMHDSEKRYVISYNGELYNYRTLRKTLQAKGHRFRSETDTEVVLAAYAEWGAAALERFNGMFAFAVWDRIERRLFLARDRYGIKPLYYTIADNAFIFASEIKAMLEYPSCEAALDQNALIEYFTFQNFFSDATLFRSISIVPPGTYMHIPANGDDHVSAPHLPIRYWDYDFREPESALAEDAYIDRLDELLTQALRRNLVSDVEIGCYLSGGMDTGTLTALAARAIPYVKTYTVGFDITSASGVELAYDERSTAEYMSYLFKTEHYEMVLKSGDMERCMEQLVWHLEEPRVGQSYPNFYAAKLASSFAPVVISGAGSDELFGGYPWRYYRAVVNNDFEHYVDKYYQFWQRLMDDDTIKRLFSPLPDALSRVRPRDIMRNVYHRHAGELTSPEDYINHSLYFEAKTFLHGLLVVEDKLSMAHSLETRVPFLDNDLVDFAMSVPVHCKLGNLGEVVRLNENEPGAKTERYYNKTRDGKLILRKAMSRFIPETVTQKKKQGFSAPDASWFRGESIDYVRSRLLPGSARIYDFMDRKETRRLVEDHLSGRCNRRLLLWSLLCFEEWCRRFL